MAPIWTAAHAALGVLFALPGARDRARTWGWAWEPVGDWRPIVFWIPFLLALAATVASFRSRRHLLGASNLVATAAWAAVLVVQLLSRSVV